MSAAPLTATSPAFHPGQPWWRVLLMLAMLCWTTGCASLPANTQRTATQALAPADGSAMVQLAQARRAQANARADSGFAILDSVDAAFSGRLALIEGAQRTLDLQYYAIHADASTEILLRRLRAAAQRGVRVRILLDDFNTVGDDAQVLRLAFVPGVEIRLFNPLTGSRASLIGRIVTSLNDAGRIQKRMHNKLFIADNAWGIAGGRNLGDAYFGGDDKSAFVDLDVLAAGRIVRDMSASFDRYWNDELAYPVQRLLDAEDLEKLRKPEAPAQPDASRATAPAARASAAQAVPIALTNTATVLPDMSPTAVAEARRPVMDLRSVTLTWAPAVLLADQPGKIGPGDDEVNAGETVVDGLLQLMRGTQRDLLIVSPYFVPGVQMMAVFEGLRQRNVRIRVLTNSLASNDAPAAHAGYARYRDRLLALGVELYEMRSDPADLADVLGSGSGSGSGKGRERKDRAGGGFLGSGPGGSKSLAGRASLHSKAVVIDGRLAVIGSMNLDLRSQKKNSEVALLIRSTALSQEAIRQVEHTFGTAAYRLEKREGRLHWRAPAGAHFTDASSEPGASAKLKLLVRVLGPIAPEEML